MDKIEDLALHYANEVNEGNMEQFEKAIKEVRVDTTGIKSDEMCGLYLMYLLALKKIKEFNYFIEKIAYEKRQAEKIATPIKLQRFLEEGAYNSLKQFDASHLPSAYKPFLQMMKDSVDKEKAKNKKQQASTSALANGAERVLQPVDTEGNIRQILHIASQFERIV